MLLAVGALSAALISTARGEATLAGWFPLGAVVGALVLCRAWCGMLAHAVRVTFPVRDVTVTRSDDATWQLAAENRSPLPAPRACVTVVALDGSENAAEREERTIALGPFDSEALGFKAPSDHVGALDLIVSSVTVTDPLGLFEGTEPMRRSRRERIRVLPRLNGARRVPLRTAPRPQGNSRRQAASTDAADYAAARAYEPGDPLRSIHWKLSARTESYMTKLYEEPLTEGVSVVIDTAMPVGISREESRVLFDALVESGISVALAGKRRGLETELLYLTARRRDGRPSPVPSRCADLTQTGVPELVDRLALPGPAGDAGRQASRGAEVTAADDLLRSAGRDRYGTCELVICTASPRDAVLKALRDARHARRNVTVIVATSETTRDDAAAGMAAIARAGATCLIIQDAAELDLPTGQRSHGETRRGRDAA